MITQIFDTLTVGFSGGDIAIGSQETELYGDRAIALTLQRLTKVVPIGQDPIGVRVTGKRAALIFTKPETIDVLIHALREIKAKCIDFPQPK